MKAIQFYQIMLLLCMIFSTVNTSIVAAWIAFTFAVVYAILIMAEALYGSKEEEQ